MDLALGPVELVQVATTVLKALVTLNPVLLPRIWPLATLSLLTTALSALAVGTVRLQVSQRLLGSAKLDITVTWVRVSPPPLAETQLEDPVPQDLTAHKEAKILLDVLLEHTTI